jgi:uncharacterized membrane protein (UPF0127 family)
MSVSFGCRALFGALAVLAIACDRASAANESQDEQHILNFDSAAVRLASPRDTVRLQIELAVTTDQRTMGLMERRQLADDHGMLFVYDSTQPPTAGFWMFRTKIPLDIAFLDSAGVVRSTRNMVPCETVIAQGCPTYTPDVPYRYALELSSGFLQRHGIAVDGSKLLLADIPNALLHGGTRTDTTRTPR